MRNKIQYTDTSKQKSTVEVGQFYRNDVIDELYIVAEVQPPGMYVLIGLNDGVSWTELHETIDDIFDGQKGNFTLITDPFTITPNNQESQYNINMKENKFINLKKLTEINTAADIKSFEVRDEYEDDHQQCAEVTINGIDCEFMWYDNVGFIHYWDESNKAFDALKQAIMAFAQQHVEALHEDGECSSEECKELYDKCQRFFDERIAELVGARK